jgi:hypothetical protein
VQAHRAAAVAWAAVPHGPGRPPDWPARIAQAQAAERAAGAALEQAIEQQVGVRLCVRDLGQSLHPVDVQTGAVPAVATVETRLTAVFEELWQRVMECGLGERRWKLIEKAQRLVPSWVASLAWWHRRAAAQLDAENLAPPLRTLLWEVVLPTRYLERVLRQTTGAAARARLRALGDRMRAPLRLPAGLWQQQTTATRRRLDALVQEIVDRWQRASSAVEGRNGVLGLHHHHLRGLPPARLKALTAVHNFVVRRADGTTAAQRFFGASHGDLFEHLVAVMPLPALPRTRRKRPPPEVVPLGN